MAINIGPRIGVDGEAQYRAQLQNIIQATKTLKAEMEQTESAFGENASSMDRARAKAENLTKQIDLQRQRVDQLKDMVQKSAEKYGEADTRTLKWKEALANATTELNRMEGELKQLSPQVKSIGDRMAESGEKLKAIGAKMKDVGDAMTKYVTGPIVAVGGASIAAFKEVDKGTDTLIAKTGATGEALDSMTDSMERLATTIPTDFETAGAAVGEVNTRFGLTGERLEELSGKFIKFAKLNGTDVSGSIDKVQSSMAAWNIDAGKTGDVLDMLNKAGQDTGVNVDKLAGSLQTNSTALKEMGFDLESSIALLANLEKNGVDSSTAVMGLKKALQNAIKQGKPLDEALSDVEATLKSATDNTDAMGAAVELFGSKAGPQLAAAIKEGRISFEQTQNTLSDFTGSVEDTFGATVDGADEFAMALNEVKATGAEVGKTLLTMAVPAIRKVGEFVREAKEKWDGLNDAQKETIIKVAGVIAAVGPALSIGGRLISGLGTVLSFGPQIIAAFSGVAAFATGTLAPAIAAAAAAFAPLLVPAGLVVAAIIAAVVVIVKNWDKIKEAAGKLKDAVVKKWEELSNNIKAKVELIKLVATTVFNYLRNYIPQKANEIKTNVTNTFEAIKTGISDKINAAKTSVTNTFDAIKDKVSGAASGAKKAALDEFEKLKDGVVDKVSAAESKLADIFDKIKSIFNVTLKPNVKLPHIRVSGKFSINPPEAPKVSVDWYRKAYNNPLMFSTPTIVGGRGFGDGAGGEIVIGKDTMLAWIRDAVSGGGTTNNSTSYGDINVVVNAAPGQNVRELADLVADRIQQQVSMRRRAT